ncbi:uncharacterized protein LOC109840289 isoform X2 [Asparagus officinalis]|uniref:uncharacterized protein LOC109840289 isoform X2 n=1 Tax=Asparagus officinalis TaxID=4686 RepID=UPI00098E6B09|nr:uncharacterized protein LOC109840289 isoform X2 [Asparagus officinalis]
MDRGMVGKDSRGYEAHPVLGMESVVATVSGYHGTEKFKLIKLIAQTGANYVGAMDRFTTHLVCWRFEGRKFDLARRLGTCIISHLWFEDCLKQGKRLPEGPYTMQSGQEAGPISWEMPSSLDTRHKEKALLKKKRKALSDRSNASDFSEEDNSTSCFDISCSDWSDSSLLKEVSGFGLTAGPARRRRHLIKKGASHNPIDLVILDSHLAERRTPLKDNNSAFVDLEDVGNMFVRSAREVISEFPSPVFEESRREAREPNENTGEQDNFNISINSSPSFPGTSQTDHGQCTRAKADFCNVGDNQNELCNIDDEQGEAADDEQGEAADQELNTGLSCVICWTDFSSVRGVLACGHRFCYSCIQGWADCMASKGKVSTCPLCKTSFSHITKFEDTASYDQKIYSQSIPCGLPNTDTYMLSSSIFDHHCTSNLFVMSATIVILKISLPAAISVKTSGCTLAV